MVIGTTPAFTLKLKKSANVDFRQVGNIYITLKQGTNTLTKSGQSIQVIDDKTLRFSITQTESLSFTIDKAIQLQVNWTYSEGLITRRAATKIIQVNLENQLLKQELQ